MVDSLGCDYSCSSLHHPDLHGPTDNCRHYQPQRAQTAGKKKLPCEPVSLAVAVIHVPICPPLCYVEGLWVPPGPAHGRDDAGGVLHHGLALVRSSHGAVHLSRQQPEAGVGELGSRRAASLPGHQRAEVDWTGHLPAHGLLCIHDWSPAG